MPIDACQPIVLVGGKSRRFGRDKLIEPVGDAPMVARPIRALRAVFGPRVAIVGQCDPRVRELADLAIDDPYPGTGPAGGILAALKHARSPVFVLPGDLPAITPETILAITSAAESAPNAQVCMGHTDRPQPCIALYQPGAADAIREAMLSGRKLHLALPEAQQRLVPIHESHARNVNRPTDLP